MTTLYSYVNALPALNGKTFWDGAAPEGLPLYAVVYASPGGVETAYHQGVDALRVYPRVTVYAKPVSLEQAPHARTELETVMDALLTDIWRIDTHLDARTPYLRGSTSRQNYPEPLADEKGGGFYATLMLSALTLK